jgi:hypothetical protein
MDESGIPEQRTIPELKNGNMERQSISAKVVKGLSDPQSSHRNSLPFHASFTDSSYPIPTVPTADTCSSFPARLRKFEPASAYR